MTVFLALPCPSPKFQGRNPSGPELRLPNLMPTSLNLEKGTFSEYFHVPFKQVKKYTFLDWTCEWGPPLIFSKQLHKISCAILPSNVVK